MIKLFPLSILISILSFYAALRHLDQSITSYFDFVAFFVVLGGTFSVGIVLFPWEYKSEALRSLRLVFSSEKARYRQVVEASVGLIQNGSASFDKSKLEKGALSSLVLQQGLELLSLSFDNDRFEMILRERIYHGVKRIRRVANALRALSKYPPAFGLTGTVLGLVNIMRGLSSGLDAKQTAMQMAIALVATFYGLLVANLLISPAGELILKKAQEEEELAEIALQTLLLMNSKVSPLEAIETINSFIPQDEKVGFESGAKVA